MNHRITNQVLVPLERIDQAILLIRGQKVMLDRDLAELYGVSTKVLNQAVKRHQNRFPTDFMFSLNKDEFNNWKSQFVTPNSALKMGLRHIPHVFTEYGVLMLSSVLNSERAIFVNIEIMRAFVRLRRLLSTNVGLARKLSILENKYDAQFKVVFDTIRKLMIPPEPKRRPTGFRKR